MNKDYFQKVYAGVLGKVIGVYLGRPFEGWVKKDIEAKFGEIDRFVADEINLPLVVSDDDISGTLTFFRTLEDSGRYEHAEHVDFADNWLNYLIENETVLWWGGYGVSSEHTAYINLKRGILPPYSGSAELNGKVVAEQIGAQIFIDAFGLAAPGKPEIAARLAKKAASVSHDGEAVHAAVLQAVMVSIAFEETDIQAVIRKALAFIPADSVIAQLYRFVYEHHAAGKDWRGCFAEIETSYGYDKFMGGNCHVIPNHAIMAMSYIYSENDFHLSQLIVNTAGWDTDCNAANVGAVMGVLVGVEGINRKVDFQSSFQDRLLMPSADGTDTVSDCLIEAVKVARAGAKIMGYEDDSANWATHHFALKGSYHGYREYGDGVKVKPAKANQTEGLYIDFVTGPGKDGGFDHLAIPLLDKPLVPPSQVNNPAYHLHGTPTIYSGNQLQFAFGDMALGGDLKLTLWVETAEAGNRAEGKIFAETQTYVPCATLTWTVPDTQGLLIQRYGIKLESASGLDGTLHLKSVNITHQFVLDFGSKIGFRQGGAYRGWLNTTSKNYCLDCQISYQDGNLLTKNEGTGFFVTGNRTWNQADNAIEISVNMANKIGGGGIVFGYQGIKRYAAIIATRSGFDLVVQKDRFGTKKSFSKAPADLEYFDLKVKVQGNAVTIFVNDEVIAAEELNADLSGGAGLIVENGSSFFNHLTIKSLS
jgi:ADP-ribosylglycohydrolase